MMVTFVSQCEKKALSRTRRVLDAFADRIGDNTWQTVITQEGLLAVKKLLRKTATKNTAVSCHWIRSRSRSELVWVVGQQHKFDLQGRVPVNYTEANMQPEESTWLYIEAMSILSGIAGLFHDVGKANVLFQRKLDRNYIGKAFEPYRHEWVSLKIFQAFVGQDSDKNWISRLSRINSADERDVVERLSKLPSKSAAGWKDLPSIATVVSWLVVSHHRLPISSKENRAPIEAIDDWFKYVDSSWNANRDIDTFEKQALEDNWTFELGTPISSVCWQIKARSLAKRAQNCLVLLEKDNWLEQRFSAHLSRLSLMLADHFYSSLPRRKSEDDWRDPNYLCYANTDGHKHKKQKLDEHNIAVASYASRIMGSLPSLRRRLPEINSSESRKALSKPVEAKFKDNFGWQDKATKLASDVAQTSNKHGFFGINMASTGCGKTLANAKIMYALSGQKPCRFSIALGLRTLTLQTGDALKDLLKLNAGEIAVLIGSQAVTQLHKLRQGELVEGSNNHEKSGSESATPLFDENIKLEHQEDIDFSAYPDWLTEDPRLLTLLHAPVLVSTIDYLIPATEGVRGGRQIAPMLRLLTSDLILDEPDDFGLEDMPALCRLVNWAGMLGSRVLLSTASLPPSLAYALFDAYREGRNHFLQATEGATEANSVCCAWFDESIKPVYEEVIDLETYQDFHCTFVNKRVQELQKRQKPVVKGKLQNLYHLVQETKSSQVVYMADAIHRYAHELHRKHANLNHSGKQVSIGLIRVANIIPLVAMAKHLFAMNAEPDYRLHICVYHSQYPLIIRSYIEKKLDQALQRKDETTWWEASGIESHIAESSERQHIFIVLATPVAEVGRDHDYDWAIAEPSSMRSLIQLAGRIQRHRKQIPQSENFYIFDTNYRGLKREAIAYCRPGFESKDIAYSTHDLSDLLEQNEYETISAIPRIQQPKLAGLTKESKFSSFNSLEHMAQQLKLFGNPKNSEVVKRLLGGRQYPSYAKLWWQHSPTWSAEMQAMQPFRKSQVNDYFCLAYSERVNELLWQEKDMTSWPVEVSNTNKIKTDHFDVSKGKGIQPWLNIDIRQLLNELAEQLEMSDKALWQTYTEVQLRQPKNREEINWFFNEYLGIYQEIKES